MRNLQEVPINGRPVRIELSNDERAGMGPGRRGPPPGAFGRHGRDVTPPAGMGGNIDMSLLPPGQDPPPGQKATDAISKTLAEVNPGQMQEVMAGMKVGNGSFLLMLTTRRWSRRSPSRRGSCSCRGRSSRMRSSRLCC